MTRPLNRLIILLLCFCGTGTGIFAQEQRATKTDEDNASEKTPAAQYVRLKKSDDVQPEFLQTSIVSFVSHEASEVVVDLIGAIHVGETEYYDELNRRFKDYDAILYELVAPEGTRIPKGGVEPSSSVSYMQNGMTKALGLAFQLNHVDYTCDNFVHADMSPEEFSESMKRREESIGKMFFRALGQSMVKQHQSNGSADVRMLAALVSDNRELALKKVMAEQFADMDGAMLVFEGPNGSTLVTERNKKALTVLRRELKDGKKRIGIFFGAGHMKDMGERLVAEFNLKQTTTSWLTAWDLGEVETK